MAGVKQATQITPDCERCFDTGFWQGQPRSGHEVYGTIYPAMMCHCSAAINWLAANPYFRSLDQGMRYRPGLEVKDSFSTHLTQYIRYRDSNRYVALDTGAISDIVLLWSHGIDTEFCCEGGYWPGQRYVKLTRPEDVDKALELLPWAFAGKMDRQRGAVYDVPGGQG